MLFNQKKAMLMAGLVASSLLVSSCGLMGPTKEEQAAEQVKTKQAEERQAARVAEKKQLAKKVAKEKAAAEEDAIQVKDISVVETPKSEKLQTPPIATVKPATSVKPTLDIPSEPDTYLVTKLNKDKTHPFFSVGDERGFAINGEQGKYVIARRNHPVTFQVRTGPMHDFYISTSKKGWGAAVYRAGVSGQFTYNGNVTMTANVNTPDTLFYACRNHNSMGGEIVVVDENADLALVTQAQDAKRKTALAKLESLEVKAVDPKKVKQKITYVGMLLQFKGKGLPPLQLGLIEDKLNAAKALESAGDMAAALATAAEAAELFNKKSSEIGPTAEELAEQKEGFNDLLITLESFVDAHLASYKQAKEEERKTVSYNSDDVGNLIVDAKNLAGQQKYEAAGKQIKKAERMVTRALNEMLNSHTIVYDLNFKTPAEEFKYEVNRYKGYAELIPVAIEVKKPSAGSIKYAKTFQDKSEFFKSKAQEAAKAGRWEEAMVVIKDATMEIRRGLRILGVSM